MADTIKRDKSGMWTEMPPSAKNRKPDIRQPIPAPVTENNNSKAGKKSDKKKADKKAVKQAKLFKRKYTHRYSCSEACGYSKQGTAQQAAFKVGQERKETQEAPFGVHCILCDIRYSGGSNTGGAFDNRTVQSVKVQDNRRHGVYRTADNRCRRGKHGR